MSGSKRQNRRALIGYRARDFGRFSQGRSRSPRQCPRGWLGVPRTGHGPARVPISSDATIACRTAARPCRRLLRSTATAHRSQGCGRRKHRPRARLASSSCAGARDRAPCAAARPRRKPGAQLDQLEFRMPGASSECALPRHAPFRHCDASPCSGPTRLCSRMHRGPSKPAPYCKPACGTDLGRASPLERQVGPNDC